ncbi:hypothetical protein S40288_10359 [Stachybotrys chartarum IBT 40288]|nr:hypothetical protein S40288_10359 [Stachybotrys chartarum IBT 40288]
MNDFYKVDWPTEITIDSNWLYDLRKTTGNSMRFTVYYNSSKPDYDKLIDKHIKNPDVAKQLKKRALPETLMRFLYKTLEKQWFNESKKFFAKNKTYRIFAAFAFSRKQIDRNVKKITKLLQDEMKAFHQLYLSEAVNLDCVWIHTGGAASKPQPTDSAFYWREALYHTYVEILWKDKWMELNMRGFMSKLKKKFRPYSLGKAAAFFSFPDRDLKKDGYERAYFGENRQELRQVKEIWDKDNFFRWPQGIQLPRDAVDDANEDMDVDDSTD